MSLYPCLDCGKIYERRYRRGARCQPCQRALDQTRNKARPHYQTPTYKRAQAAAKQWLGRNCPNCLKIMTKANPPTVDHITPIAQGGSADDPANFQVLCRACNSGKRDRPPMV